jgi:RNA polymerase sigma factor (sigma-70 family)
MGELLETETLATVRQEAERMQVEKPGLGKFEVGKLGAVMPTAAMPGDGVPTAEGSHGLAELPRNHPEHSVFSEENFPRLLEALRNGDQQAMTLVCQHYGDWLRGVIRGAIHPRVRQRYDSVDFVQSTWVSLLTQRERLPQLASSDELARYLARIAFNRVHDASRESFRTKKRDMRRECGLSALEQGQGGHAAIKDRRQARPSEFFCARERMDNINKCLEQFPPHMRQIPRRRAFGESFLNIARSIGVHERTVRRFLKDLLRVICGDGVEKTRK